MKERSLTRTLMAGVLLAELLCAVCFSAIAIIYEMNGRRHAFDIMLRGRADSVLGAVQDAEDYNDDVTVDQTELALPREDLYEVLSTSSGRVIGRSPSSSPDLLNALSSSRVNGYFSFKVAGERYRALRAPGIRVIDREEHGGFRRPVTIVYAAPIDHLWHEAVLGVRFYVIASALLLIFTGFVIAWFLRRSMSPLRELAVRAQQVSATSWDFDVPEEALLTRELEPIASSIQNLLLGLQGSFERQRQFTGDAAHELKTSIAVLKSRLQLISMRERTAQEYERNIDELLTDTQRMEDLTNRMLTLARVEQATSDEIGLSDLSRTIRLVIERLEPAMRLRDVSIGISSEEHGLVKIDPEDADILCSNLLMNAAQYSAPGTRINVSTSLLAENVELLISDEGEGISEEALPHIFERFYKSDPSRSRSNGGVGLGLSICKAIVKRCGGSISICSAPQRGTRVRVLLSRTSQSVEPSPELRSSGR